MTKTVFVYPTETAYALGCFFGSWKVVERVYAIKKRPLRKQLPVIAASVAMVRRYVRWNKRVDAYSRGHWPGAVTLILSLKKEWKRRWRRQAPSGTIAVRVSAHPVAVALSRNCGGLIVSTSANISGRALCYTVEDVVVQFKVGHVRPDMYIDGGKLPMRKPSMIIDCTGEEWRIIRD